MRRVILVKVAAFLVIVSISLPALSDWFVVQDAGTGSPQAVWSSPTALGVDKEIYYSHLAGTSWVPPKAMTATNFDEGSLAVAPDPSEGLIIVWGTVGTPGLILMSTIASEGAEWTPEIVISDPDEQSENPSIAVLEESTYVAYEVVNPNGSRSVKAEKLDSGGAVERTLVANASQSADLWVRLHGEEGHLWADWSDATGSLGYSELLDGVWQSPEFEPHSGAAGIDAARARVRERILGLP